MVETILVVDDNLINRRLLATLLQVSGYRVLVAEDGQQALEMALAERPDLVLLDVMMPKIDGFDVCSQLKKDPCTTDIPVIFLSARAEVEDKIRGLDIGGADYITKPFSKAEVLARVRNQLRLRSLTVGLERANAELQKKQKHLSEDLCAAAGIQQSLLPQRPPNPNDLLMAWKYRPCESIGGDIFNVFPIDEHRYAAYVLDVSGHGVPSALVTVSVSQSLQPHSGIVLRPSGQRKAPPQVVSPSNVLGELEKQYPFERFDKFFTIAYLLIDLQENTVRYSNAGHPPPILLRSDGSLDWLDRGGPFIGLGTESPFEEDTRALSPGDRLILYTDGVLECRSETGEFFGEQRLIQAVGSRQKASLGELVQGVMQELERFQAQRASDDDVTLLALEFSGRARCSVAPWCPCDAALAQSR